MIIKDKDTEIIKFYEVGIGEIFRSDGEFYMATEETKDKDGIINAVELSSGDLCAFAQETKVEKVDGFFQVL